MNVNLVARIRKLLESIDAESAGAERKDLTMTQQLELLIAQGGDLEHLVANGRAFWTGTTAALAAVVAIPTTGNMLSLYNTDADGGRSLLIDWVGAINVVSTAVVCQAQLLGLVGQIREADTSVADAALTLKKLNGMSNKGKVDAPVITGTAALPAGTGIAANWFPVGPSVSKPSAVGTPGYGLYQETRGKLIIPPGRFWAQHVQANVVGETFVGFVGFRVKQLSLA